MHLCYKEPFFIHDTHSLYIPRERGEYNAAFYHKCGVMKRWKSLKVAPWHIWPQFNMTTSQRPEWTTRKVKLLVIQLQHQTPILLAITTSNKMIFPGNHTPLKKGVTSRCKNIDWLEKSTVFYYVWRYAFIIKCYRLYKIDRDEYRNWPKPTTLASKLYTLPLKHQEQVRKELNDLEKVGAIQRSLSPYAFPIIVGPSKCPIGSPVQETKKTLCWL